MKSSSGVESTSVMSCEWVITLEAVSWAQVPVVERSRDDMCGIVVSAQRLGRCYYETMKSSSGVESTSVMSCEWVITIKAVSWAQVPVVERSRNDIVGSVVSAPFRLALASKKNIRSLSIGIKQNIFRTESM